MKKQINVFDHVEAHTGEGHRTDDDTDDDAADANGDGALGPFHRGFDNLAPGHAGLFPDPAGPDGSKDSNDRSIQRRVTRKHEGNQYNQRNHQVSLLPDYFHRIGNVFL